MAHDHRGCKRVIIAAACCLVGLWSWRDGAQAVEGPPIPQPGQAVEAKPGGREQGNENQAARQSWPSSIEEAEKKSKAECGSAEACRSQQRDYSDLRAQWQAADAAKAQQALALFQTLLAGIGTLIAAIGTGLLIWTLCETRRATKAATEANELSRQALIADHRPWLAVDVDFTEPITWDDVGGHFHFIFTIRNTGRTPALYVHIDPNIICFPDTLRSVAVAEAQRRIAEEVRGHDRSWGFAVFPEERVEIRSSAIVSKAAISRAIAQHRKHGVRSDSLGPWLVGSVSYCSAFDKKAVMQTGFVRPIARIVDGRAFDFGPSDGTIPVDQLELRHSDESGVAD
jgi:hypothetical protein